LNRALVLLAVAWTTGVTVARTLRWPNDFAEAHWLLDYRLGFIRRGLAGDVLRRIAVPFNGSVTEGAIAAAAAIVFVAFCLALLGVVLRILRRTSWAPDAVLACLAFLSSTFVVTSAHIFGYLDQAFLLLVTGAAALVLRGRVLPGAIVACLAILVHESALVVGFPAVILAWWLKGDGNMASRLRGAWLLLPIAIFVASGATDRMQQDPATQERLTRRLARAEFVRGDMHVFVPAWLAEDFSSKFEENSRHAGERLVSAPQYGRILPTLAALLAVAFLRFRLRRADAVLVAATAAAPLVLHLVAWDTDRIWTYVLANAFLALWAVAETTPPLDGERRALRALGVLAIAVNAILATPLLDGLAERFTLGARLALYAPVLAAAAYLIVRRHTDRADVGDRRGAV
jgi:hypothetical protein